MAYNLNFLLLIVFCLILKKLYFKKNQHAQCEVLNIIHPYINGSNRTGFKYQENHVFTQLSPCDIFRQLPPPLSPSPPQHSTHAEKQQATEPAATAKR